MNDNLGDLAVGFVIAFATGVVFALLMTGNL